MDENKIRQIVQQELQRNNNASRFTINSIPQHTHDGINSPSIFSPTITYTGFVPFDGVVANTPFVFLPSGWQVELQVGNIYKITHNLDTEYYSVMVCMTGPEASDLFVPITICQDNFFEISWSYNNVSLTLQTDFHFTLVQVNNKRNALPTYSLSGG
jgi:hypothetical protein